VPGLGPGIHVFVAVIRGRRKIWMAGTSPAKGILVGVWMNDLNRQQMFLALIGLVMALFVMSGLPGRWRRQLRAAAIVVFIVAIAVALVEIALWFGAPGR
jgi:hypothetical protein